MGDLIIWRIYTIIWSNKTILSYILAVTGGYNHTIMMRVALLNGLLGDYYYHYNG